MKITRRAVLGAGLAMALPLWPTAPQAAEIIVPGDPFPIQLGEEGRLEEAYRKQLVAYDGEERPGTIVVEPERHFLHLVMENARALRYGVGVGRAGFEWKGDAQIARKARWPGWWPPAAMRKRQPYLPAFMPGGPENPLGARALYLYQNGRDTLYRIHGTNEADTIGKSVSSGCIRMLNEHAVDLYNRVPVGSRVVVL